ncbi:YdgA family protein [Endozoicomonas euniceicola]|uniref:YdgA family protein n=1 Tax=Endozoicomonas euniceicola TaxID=1234143 RepID=A0ABY6GQP2_9GAMM|nr:YdgA family protein [Endozoicomonas euniceicola]UYM15067.1 YdgA family protein [Endozoicomonas euniceicola]
MTNTKKLWISGMAGLAGLTVLGMPALNGFILESRLKNDLVNLAEQHDYRVENLSISRGYGSTDLELTLQGTGLRKINGQALELTGTLNHGSLFSVPGMVSGDLDVNYYTYEQGVRFTMPGTISGSMNLNGSISARLTTEGIEWPLDPEAVLTLQVDPTEGQLTSQRSGTVAVDMEPLVWTVHENSEPLFRMAMNSPVVEFSTHEQSWSMTAPEVSYSVPSVSSDVLLVVDNFQAEGEQTRANDQLSSHMVMSTGSVTVPLLSEQGLDNLIEGLSISSSVENVDRNLLERIPELLGRGDAEQVMSVDDAGLWLRDLISTQPRIAVEEVSVQTSKGHFSFAFDLAGTDKTKAFVEQFLDNPPQTPIEESLMTHAAMQSLAVSASVHLSDELLGWGCEYIPQQMVQEQGGQPAEAVFYSAMCQTMVNSGDFLTASCLQFQDSGEQVQCLNSMQQAKAVWKESRTLKMALEDGLLMLNGVELTQFPL